MRRAIAAAALAVAASGCCCFGDLSLPPPRRSVRADDPAIIAAAREYLEQHTRELLEPAAALRDPDAGGRSCTRAMLEVAAAVGTPLITRGHAGTELGAEVTLDVGACAARVRVLVQHVAATGAWIAIGARTLVGLVVVATVGDPLELVPDLDPDVDVDLDELFD